MKTKDRHSGIAGAQGLAKESSADRAFPVLKGVEHWWEWRKIIPANQAKNSERMATAELGRDRGNRFKALWWEAWGVKQAMMEQHVTDTNRGGGNRWKSSSPTGCGPVRCP